LSAILAWVTSSYAPVAQLLYVVRDGSLAGFTPLGLIIGFAPLVILLMANVTMRQASPAMANVLFWVIVALVGASLGSVVLLYTGASIVSTFLITAAAFGGLSLAGYTTKRDLSGMRTFLIMGLWGLVAAFVVGGVGSAMGFFSEGPLFWILNGVGVLIVAGLIAAETQHLKMVYWSLRGNEAGMSAATSIGALNLYLDFINLFRFLLFFLGGRR
jgi:FtsH-binding integral membrane protein